MNIDYKFTNANINKVAFNHELEKRGSYYANVVMWTTLFTLPLFILLDLLFCKDLWIDFLFIRIVGAVACYLVYVYGKSQKWNYAKLALWFCSAFVVTNAIITALVPNDIGNPMAYFLILGIIILILNSTIFWSPINSIILCVFSYVAILLVYILKPDSNKYSDLMAQGGTVYFIISAFSCFLAYTRFHVLCREVEKTVTLDEASNKLISKAEEIKEQQFKVEEANRKLKSVTENSLDNMTVIMDDYKNFSSNVKTQLEEIKSSAYNLMPSQLDAINKITAENEKLNYLAEKLGDTANAVTAVNLDTPKVSDYSSVVNTPVADASIQFSKELFDLNPEVEKSVLDIAESAILKGMNLQLNISPAANNVYQDKLFTAQALNKLMNNVIRLSDSGSVITVRAEQVDNHAIIETVSHGNIIGNDRLEEMMNRLKYSSITDENALNDLGLIATKKLVESMNGKFVYNSETQTGNYFKIEFPSA